MGICDKRPLGAGILVGGNGYAFSHDGGVSGVSVTDGVSAMYSGVFKQLSVDGDCIGLQNVSEEEALLNRDGYFIGNAYGHWGAAGRRTVYIEELKELDYRFAAYVLVAEGADSLLGGDLVSLGGVPRNFQCGAATYCYVTYEGNAFTTSDDSVVVDSPRVTLFTGRMARRWLSALGGNSFQSVPVNGDCVRKYDFSVMEPDGLTEVSGIAVPNLYIGDCIHSLADPNVLYDVPGVLYTPTFRLKSPGACCMPYVFRFTMDNSPDRPVVLLDESDESVQVRWLTGRTVKGNKSYVLTVQGCVARLEEVLETV